MDKLIHRTLDNRDALHERVKKDIEALQKGLDLHALLEAPEKTLQEFASGVTEEIVSRYADAYVEEGVQFARAVIAKRTPVQVDPAGDPELNKGELG